ncbi:MAG: hypothetical protein ABH850_04975 [Candidatus Micrarchaeota archaeon]
MARELLLFCKKKGNIKFEMEFATPNLDNDKPFINPQILKKAEYSNCENKPFFAHTTFNQKKQIKKEKEPAFCEVIHKIDNDFIEWYKNNELISWQPFKLNIFNKNDILTAAFDEQSISLHFLTKSEANFLKEKMKKHKNKQLKIEKMKPTFFVGLEGLNKNEILRNFRGRHFINWDKDKTGEYMEISNDDFYLQLLSKPSEKKKLNFDFSLFDDTYKDTQKNKKVWEPEKAIKIFGELEEEIKNKKEMLPKRYSATAKFGTSGIPWVGDWFEINSKKYQFKLGWNKAIAKCKDGKKINLLKDSSEIKIGKKYKAKKIVTNQEVEFEIETSNLYQSLKWSFFDRTKKLCEYAKQKNYKIWMNVMLE